jgi:hypothetical protein
MNVEHDSKLMNCHVHHFHNHCRNTGIDLYMDGLNIVYIVFKI